MSDRGPRRPWLAALLALVVSGLGHAYLRRWARALGWYAAVTATVVLFVPESAIDGVFAGDPPPIRAVAPAAAVVAASVIDAYVVAHRVNREREGRPSAVAVDGADEATGDASGEPSAEADAVRCPACGKETDATVDFCQWCAEPLREETA
jgi:hypothetical protein